MPNGMRWVGLDVHAHASTLAVFDDGTGEVITRRVVGWPLEVLDVLRELPRPVRAVYEAGPTGYGLVRRARAEGIEMVVCSPGNIERRPGDRIKTDKRDAIRLARLFAAGDLRLVWIPSEEQEQLRDLVRCREDLRAAVTLMRALAAHHSGLPSFAELAAAVDLDRYGPAGLDPASVLIRAYAERGMLTDAKRLARGSQPLQAPLAEQSRLLSIAVLQECLGDADASLVTLREAITHAIETGCMLQLPEIVARTIRLEVADDVQSAVDHFELFDWAVGGSTDQVNETCAKLLARAAVRAVRLEFDRAAASAAIAAEVAEKQEAPLLAAQAHLARAGYLEKTSTHNEIRLAYASAARWYRVANVDRLARRAERTVSPQMRAS